MIERHLPAVFEDDDRLCDEDGLLSGAALIPVDGRVVHLPRLTRLDAEDVGYRVSKVLRADEALLLIRNLTAFLVGDHCDRGSEQNDQDSDGKEREPNPDRVRGGITKEIPDERAGDHKGSADYQTRAAAFLENQLLG